MEELHEEVRRATVDALRDSGAVFAFIHGSTARGTARAGSHIESSHQEFAESLRRDRSVH
jgi:predicted nucleotidyltransferase